MTFSSNRVHPFECSSSVHYAVRPLGQNSLSDADLWPDKYVYSQRLFSAYIAHKVIFILRYRHNAHFSTIFRLHWNHHQHDTPSHEPSPFGSDRYVCLSVYLFIGHHRPSRKSKAHHQIHIKISLYKTTERHRMTRRVVSKHKLPCPVQLYCRKR